MLLQTPKRFYIVPGVVLGGILTVALTTMAEDTELDTDPRVFPYKGVIELNGNPFDGLVDLSFALTDDGSCNVTEQHGAVAVFGGSFRVNLGSRTNGGMPACVFNAESMFIAVSVRDANEGGDFVALSGRQRIHPVPFAYWAAEGANFRIDGNANISGNIRVSGDIADPGGNLTINDNLDITGTIRDTNGDVVINDGLDVRGRIHNETGDIILNDAFDVRGNIQNNAGNVTINDTLVVNGDISDGNGDVTISDNLDITGDIQDTNGPVILNDDVQINGTLRSNSSALTLNSSLVISGHISDGDGAVFINDDLLIDDNLEHTTDTLTVADNLRVNGNIAATGSMSAVNLTLTGSLTAPNLRNDGSSSISMDREDFNTITQVTLKPTSSHFCVLSLVRVADDNDEDDRTSCEVTTSGSNWILRGQTSADDNGSSACGARCFRFR